MSDFKATFSRWAGIASGIMAGILVVSLGMALVWSIFLYVVAKASDERINFFELLTGWTAFFIPWTPISNWFSTFFS